MHNLVFCSVAFHHKIYGDVYIDQQTRLRNSIKKIYPDAPLMFWTNEYPLGSKHFLKSLYGFKPHAINALKRSGYKKIVYLDTAIVLQKEIQGDYPILAVHDPCLTPASDIALNYFHIQREQLKDIPFVGGSYYAFDFNHPITNRVFNSWLKAEQNGIFGSQDQESAGELQGHRHDETCMAICLYQNDIKPQSAEEVGYNTSDGVMTKQHFK